MEFVLVNKFFRVGKTEVSIQCDKPLTFFTRELEGDRLGDTDETLIEAVKEILRTELDPTSAIVQAQAKLQETQAKLEQAEQKLAQTEAKQTATDQEVKQNKTESDHYGKVSYALVLTLITEKLLQYGTAYKVLVDLIQSAEVGKHYMPGDLITIEDPEHVELDGEGKRVLVQLNREFTYNGEPASDFIRNGRLERDGYGAAWKYEPKEQNKPTTVAPTAAVSTTATVTPTATEPSATTVTPNQ
ncbi:conserved hypothetical protein [Streptococcus mitis B6]|uniref:Phage protein n=1 Tax=Streptococcus mitis (strain B6) TaxID=365659 RepID=D3H7A2_STRM6|nr:hypothetical protein [Streptococcus mitis]QBX26230.1 hypothetical protein Javan308_0061 [Streptococcus phage Javan308]CBJ21744.1 conserved hypothetical protein [Streptococcus mitis B6]